MWERYHPRDARFIRCLAQLCFQDQDVKIADIRLVRVEERMVVHWADDLLVRHALVHSEVHRLANDGMTGHLLEESFAFE
jgi:hypothetical protein